MNTYSTTDPRADLPSGSYYIGDPCYVIKDEEWEQALDETNYFNMFPSEQAAKDSRYNSQHLQNGVFKYTDTKNVTYLFAASTTEYGDGCYPCRDDGCDIGECGVDAGLIAAIPVEMIEEYGDESGLDNGVVYDFKAPFGVRYSDGIIKFGDVTVHTGYEDELGGEEDEW